MRVAAGERRKGNMVPRACAADRRVRPVSGWSDAGKHGRVGPGCKAGRRASQAGPVLGRTQASTHLRVSRAGAGLAGRAGVSRSGRFEVWAKLVIGFRPG